MNIIQTDSLTRRFGDTIAVDDVSIHVREGEIYGFLGLNGAGKTTTIRMFLGMIKPDSGSIQLFDKSPLQSSDIWNDVGYLVEKPSSYPDLTVIENLRVIMKLRGLADRRMVGSVIEKLGLTAYQNKKEKHLSLGNKQRLGLAKALIHHPRLLILDEPVNGLDPAGIVEIREFLKDLVENQQTTIFLSSHILSEIARLATRIGIVHEGRLIKEINSKDLEDQIIRKLQIDTVDNIKGKELLQEKGYDPAISKDLLLETTNPDAIQHPEIVSELLVSSQIPIKMLRVYEEDLESYFLRMIGKTNGGK